MEYLIEDMMSGFADLIFASVFSIAVFVVIFLVLGIAAYCYRAFVLLFTGRKAGMDSSLSWMPFVPFARTIYRLGIVGEPWWKMFIFEGMFFYIGILGWIFVKINPVLALIVVVLYAIACVVYNVYYLTKFYRAFNIEPILAIIYVIPAFAVVSMVVDALIAFTDCFHYGEEMSGGRAEISASIPMGGGSTGGRIRGVNGMYAGQEFSINPGEELIIGRDAAIANIVITFNSAKVSRKHCGILFDYDNMRYKVIDYSSNGILLENNRRLIANHPTPLPKGTLITLGNEENTFMLL